MGKPSQIEVRAVGAAATWPLRLEVLRPGGPPAAAQFPGDDSPDTKHFGAFQGNDQLVGVASLYRAEMPGGSGFAALQLRGMAATPEVRGLGVGRALVAACIIHAREQGFGLIWCNARTSAVGFYRNLGWEAEGTEFEIPDVGPHVRMWRWVAGWDPARF